MARRGQGCSTKEAPRLAIGLSATSVVHRRKRSGARRQRGACEIRTEIEATRAPHSRVARTGSLTCLGSSMRADPTDSNRLRWVTSFRHGDQERQRLEELCRQTGRTKGDVVRRLILTKKLERPEGAERVVVLTQLHGDLRKVGGLLKLGLRDRLADRFQLREALTSTQKTVRIIEDELKKASSDT